MIKTTILYSCHINLSISKYSCFVYITQRSYSHLAFHKCISCLRNLGEAKTHLSACLWFSEDFRRSSTEQVTIEGTKIEENQHQPFVYSPGIFLCEPFLPLPCPKWMFSHDHLHFLIKLKVESIFKSSKFHPIKVSSLNSNILADSQGISEGEPHSDNFLWIFLL